MRIFRLGAGLVAGAFLFWFVFLALPQPLFDDGYSFVLEASDGSLLGASIARDEQWRFPPGAAVPERFKTALVTFEDKRFYRHLGVDPLATARAARDNLRAGEIVSGGSTLTMQVIRLVRRNPDRTVIEKLVEMLLAFRLEIGSTKDDVLALFAAHAPFGGNVVGLEAAAWRYFGRSPDSLSWAENALLAVLPNSPAALHLGRDRDALKAKRDRLLQRLADAGHLDDLERRLALAEPLPPDPVPLPRLAPRLMDTVAAEADTPRVRTTLDPLLQQELSELLQRAGDTLSVRDVNNAAVVILRVDDATAAAYAGNLPGTTESPFVDIARSLRSTGSLLKPFLFAAAYDEGLLVPGQLVADVPTRMGGFSPENFSEDFLGAVPSTTALASSLNVPAARLLTTYGLERFYVTIKEAGLSSLTRTAREYGVPLILGGAEGSLWNLTAMYAALARSAAGDPRYHSPSYVAAPERPGTEPTAFPISPGASWEVLEELKEVLRPTEEGDWRQFSSAQPISWKTGTSYGFRDAWAIGVTAEYAVGVWVGNAGGEGNNYLRGFSAAAPLLFDVFGLLGRQEAVTEPDDRIKLRVCVDSGHAAGPYCPDTTYIDAPAGSARTGVCPYCELVPLDSTGEYRVSDECELVVSMRPTKTFVLPPVMEYYYRLWNTFYEPLPPWRPDCIDSEAAVQSRRLSVSFPVEGASVYIPVEMDGNPGAMVMTAYHGRPDTEIYWHLDGEYLGSTRTYHQWEVNPRRGDHILVVMDEFGERIERRFTVLSD